MERGATFWLTLGAILLAALALRLGAALWWQSRLPDPAKHPLPQAFAFPDSDTYWQLARTIYRGEPYQYGDSTLRVFRTPGYPALLAGLFLVTGDDPRDRWPLLAARFLGAILGTIAVGLVAAVARELFAPQAALAAALLAAIEPLTVGTSIFILTECPFTVCMLGQLLAMIVAERQDDATRRHAGAFAAGVLAGLGTLIRPSWLLFTPLCGMLGVATSRERMRMLWFALAMQAGLMVTMCPWWVRNWLETGRYVPTTLQVGASLYDGLNPQATGASDMRFVPAFRRAQEEADAREPHPIGNFELRLEWRMRDAALAWAAENPGRVLTLAVVKFWRMWSPWPNESSLQSPWIALGCTLTYLPLIVLAGVGAWQFARRGYGYWLCLVPAGYLTLLHVIFVSSIRYRQPPLLALIVLAAGALVVWLGGESSDGRPSCDDARDDGEAGATPNAFPERNTDSS